MSPRGNVQGISRELNLEKIVTSPLADRFLESRDTSTWFCISAGDRGLVDGHVIWISALSGHVTCKRVRTVWILDCSCSLHVNWMPQTNPEMPKNEFYGENCLLAGAFVRICESESHGGLCVLFSSFTRALILLSPTSEAWEVPRRQYRKKGFGFARLRSLTYITKGTMYHTKLANWPWCRIVRNWVAL